MSTRLRITLDVGPSRFYGKKAEMTILQTSKNVLANLPENWKQMTRREKLMHLAKKLPQGYKLTLFQEPKATRRNHSAYWMRRERLA